MHVVHGLTSNFSFQCGKKFNIDYNRLKAHRDSAEGRELLAALGDETHRVEPKIEFIPAISFHNVKYIQ